MITTAIAGVALKKFCGFVFDNPIGKMIAGGLLAITVFASWLFVHDHRVAEAAKTEVVADINTKTKELTDEAVKARAPAAKPGAAARLRQHSCRDC